VTAPALVAARGATDVDRRLRLAAIVLAVLGVGVAGYLTYVHYRGIAPICAVGHGCEKVQSSSWSKLAGVPVALLGLIGYLGILASLFVRGEAGRMAGALLALAGAGFSAYLTYREVFTIHAICQWCVASAIILAALSVITVTRLLKAEPEG
jgi:uncharacterized membrane protein